jgi:hypothetical protein
MARSSRAPLLVVLAVILGGVATFSTLDKPHNAPPSSGSLTSAKNAESTALYCTGLTDSRHHAPGHVTFINTSSSKRTLNVQVVSNTSSRATKTIELAANGSLSIQPQSFASGNYFAVAVQVSGGGVVGEEVANGGLTQTPCSSAGVTDWYGAGFNTSVGSSAILNIYNPTATPAVFNASIYGPGGFSAPAPFQGMAVSAHSLMALNLGAQIVNTDNVGVHVKVLRGSIDIVGTQATNLVTSFNAGSTQASKKIMFAKVTTVSGALAQLRVFNMSNLPADVTAHVTLGGFKIAPESLTVAPYTSGVVIITPNSAIPAAGYAVVTLNSNVPIAAALATGTTAGLYLAAPVVASNEFLISDFSGQGFDAASLTNTSKQSLKVTFNVLGTGGSSVSSASAQLAGATTSNILSLFSGLSTLKGQTLLISSSKASLVVSTTLPSHPAGIVVVNPLDRR